MTPVQLHLMAYFSHHLQAQNQEHIMDNRVKPNYGRDQAHINGIEGFWGYAKSRLSKFRGMNKRTFYLHLKECEFRFNHRHDEMYEILLESCRKKSIQLS